MFVYEKKLQYPVRIANPNPKLAAFIISQYGGPDGELGASLRYLSQRYSMPYCTVGLCLSEWSSDIRHYSHTPIKFFTLFHTLIVFAYSIRLGTFF